MSDRPSRRSPPASSRSIAAARSSDWMFRAIAVLPPSPSTVDPRRAAAAVRQCRTLPVDADLSLMVGRDRFGNSSSAHRVSAIIVRPVDALNIRARSRIP
ncbi:hypothetical protein GCM10010297_55440 [Streptomyces malachitofuscus]|nr:hypothetical protein GCM10010297_55440 [Streptomyces malachitofuscus]